MPQSAVSRIQSEVRRVLGEPRRVLLAVSGGIDSMVLLDAAVWELLADRIVVATFDHGTGEPATSAATLVQSRCAVLGVQCERGAGALAGGSEVLLRNARWSFLNEVSGRSNLAVATAHTADDQIETVFMRTLRDAGARGLAGLAAESRVLRPLLAVRRREIEDYARERALDWIEDPSNASPKFLRNRVRHDLLPALRRVAPAIDADLLRIGASAAAWRSDVDRFIDVRLDVRLLKTGGLDVSTSALANFSALELRELLPAIVARGNAVLDRRGIVRLAEFALQGRVGARVQLSGAWEVVRSRDALQLRRSNPTAPTPKALSLSESTSWSVWRFSPMGSRRVDDAWRAQLPVDRPLTVRSWRHGDVMIAGTTRRLRKVKELLSKAGVTGHARPSWPVVVAGDDILWIPGVRHSEVAADSAGQPRLSFLCEYLNR
jgi:tRNA(Ile)-lysidine synthase